MSCNCRKSVAGYGTVADVRGLGRYGAVVVTDPSQVETHPHDVPEGGSGSGWTPWLLLGAAVGAVAAMGGRKSRRRRR